MGLAKWVRSHYLECLSLAVVLYMSVYLTFGIVIYELLVPFLILLIFILPGWHLIRVLATRKILAAPMNPIYVWALVPSLSISLSLVSSLLGIVLRAGSSIAFLIVQLAIFVIVSALNTPSKVMPLTTRVNRLHLLALSSFLSIPIFQFGIEPYVSSPQSPFPYFAGWDVFAYLMLAGRLSAGTIVSPLADINPVSQQLPIPIGFPLLSSLLFIPFATHSVSAVLLLKLGAVIPAALGMIWVYLICNKATDNLYFAFIGAILSYSFAGYNVIDTKWFLPASFSWVFALAGLYVLLYGDHKSKLALLTVFVATALFFHLYTGATVS